MTVCCITAEEIQRPMRFFEGIKSADEPLYSATGRSCWCAVVFKAKIDPFDFTGNLKVVTLVVGPAESWRFYNARVALMPGSSFDSGHFVMIFDRCERVVDGGG